jgi:ABC-type polysaccharide/polyol phosphate export permease
MATSKMRKMRSRDIADGQIYMAGGKSRLTAFHEDVFKLWRDFPIILWRAWVDLKARYRRSILGPYWLSIGTLTFVTGYSILAGLLFRRPLEEFLGYIACGVIIWQLISTSLAEGSKIFVSNANEIMSVRVNLLSLPVKLLLRGLITFAHSLPIVLIVVYFTDNVNFNTLMVVPGIIILTMTLLPICAALGTIAARYRDFEQLIVMFNQFFFYMTPILWKAEMLGDGYGRWLAYGNPLFYELAIVRQPLMGQPVSAEIWLGALGFMVVSSLIGYSIYARLRQRIPFWI